MAGTLDPANLENDITGVSLGRSGVTGDGGVIERHNSAQLGGCGHLSLRETRAEDEEARVPGGAADRRRG